MRATFLSILLILGTQVTADGHLYPSDVLSKGKILYSEVVGLDVNIHTNVIVAYEEKIYKCRRRYSELTCDEIKETAIKNQR
tara:strand:+ start:405 stop:650 length:246 start_codon:yes stop_codon:yes gene_type:complete